MKKLTIVLILAALTGCATELTTSNNKRAGHFDKPCATGSLCKSYEIPKGTPGAIADAR